MDDLELKIALANRKFEEALVLILQNKTNEAINKLEDADKLNPNETFKRKIQELRGE